jgi:hypothetical protein
VKGRDAATGAPLTKRQAGATILEHLGRDGRDSAIVRKVVELASNWSSFHLSDNEYEARAVVQKAREGQRQSDCMKCYSEPLLHSSS